MGCIMVGLAACGSSGGGSDDTPVTTPTDIEPPVVDGGEPVDGEPVGSEFLTAEYFASGGLDSINAATGFGTEVPGEIGGAGTRIAVIDSGVDRHTDLSIADRFALDGSSFNNVGDHATHVAGIAAAKRDGTGIQGVAYRADIVSLKIAPDNFDSEGELGEEGLIAAAIASAGGSNDSFSRTNGSSISSDTSAQSDVVNMSFRTTDNSGQIYTSMSQAADNDKIMVAALGNEGQSNPVAAPAIYASDPQMNGLVIGVGALDSSGNDVADFSNRCGDIRNFCLFAPGEAIVSTLPDEQYGTLSGTSMAAPHVAGAAATLVAAFPAKSSEEIVQRLLTTADDLGQPGIDQVYGHGRLNLGAAISPVGTTSIPLTSSSLAFDPNSSASLLSLPAWVDDGELNAALTSVLMLDAQDFPFQVDLSTRIEQVQAASPLAQLIGRSDLSFAGEQFNTTVTAHFWQPTDELGVQRFEDWQARSNLQSDAEPGYVVSVKLTEGTALKLENGFKTSVTTTNAPLGYTSNFAASRQWPSALSGQDGHTLTMSWALDQQLQASASFARSSNADERAGNLQLHYQPTAALSLHVGTVLLDESQSSWGITGDDLTGNQRLQSWRSSIGGRYSIGSGVTLFAGIDQTIPLAQDSDDQGILRDLEQGTAFSAIAGLSKTNLFGGDQLEAIVMQPFRPQGTTAIIDIPIAQTSYGGIETATTRVDLASEGRQTDWILSYSRAIFGQSARWSLIGFAQLEPNHDPNADPILGVGTNLRWAF